MRKSKLFNTQGHELKVKAPVRKNNQNVWDVVHERDAGRAYLRNLGGKETVRIGWDLNEDCKRDQVFAIKIGDKEAYLSAEEMMRFLRWV